VIIVVVGVELVKFVVSVELEFVEFEIVGVGVEVEFVVELVGVEVEFVEFPTVVGVVTTTLIVDTFILLVITVNKFKSTSLIYKTTKLLLTFLIT
jgi:hypothetical protein